jgi:1-acyl-sn-glycerol-3-phosphate acyltransferase
VFSRLERLWRVGGTGLAFAVIGLGGGLLTATVFPALALTDRVDDRRVRRVRLVIQQTFRLYIWMLRTLGLIEVQFEGRERLAACRGRLIVANHPTLLDVVLLMSITPCLQCVVKRGLWRNPFLRGVVSAAEFIPNDLPAEELFARALQSLERGENLLIFPEGTRTNPDRPPRFLRGFANIATAAKVDLLPIVVTCQPLTLTKGEPWYRTPSRRPRYRISVGERWDAASFLRYPHRSLNARRLVLDLEAYYRNALSDGKP